jgi:DNA repair protein RadC
MKIEDAHMAEAYLRTLFDTHFTYKQEAFYAIFLDAAGKTIKTEMVSLGGRTQVHVDMKILFGHALMCQACGVLVAHNHPSGKLSTSKSDDALTKKIRAACELLDIRFYDHLIIAPDGFLSYAAEGFNDL